MRLLKPSSILFLLGMLGISRGRAQDLQTWNEIDVVGNWRKIDLTLPLVTRLDFRQSTPQLFAVGGLADIHLFADTVLTGGYLFVDLPTHNSEVHAPVISVSEKIRLGRLILSDRNQFERLVDLGRLGVHSGLGSSPVRYRNRFLIDESLARPLGGHLFAEEEAFYDFEVSHWN